MNNKILFITVCAILFLLIHACVPSTSKQDPTTATHRTYYESLDLSTPESAILTFINAFQKSDFPTVFLILSPQAQDRFRQSLSLLDYTSLVKVSPYFNPKESIATLFKFSELEHVNETSYYFDVLMMAAKEHSAFLIDLSGEVSIQGSTPFEQKCVDVITSVAGIDGNVTFRTIQAPSGRWRVLQVIVLGGDESQIPWSTPEQTEP